MWSYTKDTPDIEVPSAPNDPVVGAKNEFEVRVFRLKLVDIFGIGIVTFAIGKLSGSSISIRKTIWTASEPSGESQRNVRLPKNALPVEGLKLEKKVFFSSFLYQIFPVRWC